MNVTWISGWGVAPESLQPVAQAMLPNAEHTFCIPNRRSVERAANADLVIGWSLGAWHLLDAAADGVNSFKEVWLLAPFLAFASEFGLGGRCSLSQVKWLRRWLQREPEAALADFYQRAGLEAQIPYAAEELLLGLDVLSQDASPAMRQFVSGGLPEKWQAAVGQFDPLLDASAIAASIPGCKVIPGARHRAGELLTGLMSSLSACQVSS